jgi:hypothetical protein
MPRAIFQLAAFFLTQHLRARVLIHPSDQVARHTGDKNRLMVSDLGGQHIEYLFPSRSGHNHGVTLLA